MDKLHDKRDDFCVRIAWCLSSINPSQKLNVLKINEILSLFCRSYRKLGPKMVKFTLPCNSFSYYGGCQEYPLYLQFDNISTLLC